MQLVRCLNRAAAQNIPRFVIFFRQSELSVICQFKLSTGEISRASARADQLQHGIRCIEQWWDGSHHHHPKQYSFADEMPTRFLCQIILADAVEQRLASTNVIELWSPCDHLPDPMLRCAVLRLCAGTAFRILRNPCLCSPLGIGAGPILIAGCGGKLSASFSKKACRSGYNI
jgi:hypothetical protein